jgi:hypothetical protein
MAMPLVILEKMVLTDGMIYGGRKPATTMAIVAPSRAYSIKSWPRCSRQKRVTNSVNGPRIGPGYLPFHLEAGGRYYQPRKNRSAIG